MEYCFFCYKIKGENHQKTKEQKKKKKEVENHVKRVPTMYLVERKIHKKLILSLFCLTNNGGSLFFLYLFNILKVFMSKYYMGSESYLDGTLKK